jgi:peptidoglycan hydrolase-like protein with peptidoglycan-binding domain
MAPTLQRDDSAPKDPWVEYLQTLLGRADYETGKIDGYFGPITEAAVRQYETDHRLEPVDGIVDDLFWQSIESSVGAQTGLRDPEQIDEYVEDTIGIANTCTSAEDRRAAVEVAANERLASIGVPFVTFELNSAQAGGNLAIFKFQDWTVYLDEPRFAPEAADWATPEQQAALLGTVYHESRHSEQWFRAARYRAGLGSTADQLVTEFDGIPEWVAALAVANRMVQSSPESVEAEAWYESVYGTGRQHRIDAINSGDFDRIRALPEETDAFTTRGLMVEEFLDAQEGDARPVLRRGHFNRDQVAYLQQSLEYLRYDVGTIDGDFGDRTHAAVTAFQRDNGLADDGVVDEPVWAALDRARGF